MGSPAALAGAAHYAVHAAVRLRRDGLEHVAASGRIRLGFRRRDLRRVLAPQSGHEFGSCMAHDRAPPASNFIVAAGFIIAERTLYLPSVGAMIALASAIPWLYERFERQSVARVGGAAFIALLLALGIVRSVTRNRIWRDDDTLTRQSVIDAPDSYRTHFMLGAHLFSIGDLAGGEREYRRAIDLFPQDRLMAYAFAEQLRTSGKCDAAVPIYRWLFEAQPDSRRGHIGYAACMLQRHEYTEARQQALEWIRKGGRISLAREILAWSNAQRDSLKR
jgi:hypothetical protein